LNVAIKHTNNQQTENKYKNQTETITVIYSVKTTVKEKFF
jgi:hypothetical protein